MGEPVNDSLLEFADHWKLDGDYLRCRKCNRPHIASKAAMPFVHMSGCKLEGKLTQHPWLLLRDILNGRAEYATPSLTLPAGSGT